MTTTTTAITPKTCLTTVRTCKFNDHLYHRDFYYTSTLTYDKYGKDLHLEQTSGLHMFLDWMVSVKNYHHDDDDEKKNKKMMMIKKKLFKLMLPEKYRPLSVITNTTTTGDTIRTIHHFRNKAKRNDYDLFDSEEKRELFEKYAIHSSSSLSSSWLSSPSTKNIDDDDVYYGLAHRLDFTDYISFARTNKRHYYHFMQKEWYQKIRLAIIVDHSNHFENDIQKKRTKLSKLFIKQPTNEIQIRKCKYDPAVMHMNSDPPLVCKRKWIEYYTGFCMACRCISNYCLNPMAHFKTKRPPDGYKLPQSLIHFLDQCFKKPINGHKNNGISLAEERGLTRQTILYFIMGPNYRIIKQKERRLTLLKERLDLELQKKTCQWPPVFSFDWKETEAFPNAYTCNTKTKSIIIHRKQQQQQ